jgi:hypothetical protein
MVIREDEHAIIITSSSDGFGESCSRQHNGERPVIPLSQKTQSTCLKPIKIAPNGLPSWPEMTVARQ